MPTNVELTSMIIDLQNRVCDLEEEMKVLKSQSINPVNAVIDQNLYWIKDGNAGYFIGCVPAIKAIRKYYDLGLNEAVNVVNARKDMWALTHPKPKE